MSRTDIFKRTHDMQRESSGSTLCDFSRMVCRSCEWCGPWREQSDDFMSSHLARDAREHLRDGQ
jgi:hypothetical protein